ncbi:hypothetical protein AALP_AAs46147U000400 [Arabis alpina]|uniref:Mitochondrial import inner membrane translocase subunit TIM50 n=1 Tax=Arabis alpina TaxID=50452 RepID=A0A087FXU7_ARAAL|nr:hypothetical protein AALP_AAs46147U000400 [Arabis alpina]
MASKSTKPRPEISKKKKTEKRSNTGNVKKLEIEANKEESTVSCGREIVSFVKAENPTSLGLDEAAMLAGWDSFPDGPKKRLMEATFNKLYAMKADLCVDWVGLVSQVVNCTLKPSSSVLSHNKTVVDVSKENETGIDVSKETCVASGSDELSGNGPVLSQNKSVIDVSKETCVASASRSQVIQLETRNISAPDRKHIDPKQSVTLAAEGSCVRSNPSVSSKKLLVLDLNGLLANIVSSFPDCKADIIINRRAVFKRPFCDDFLNFCFEKFQVGIWSSRKQHNVKTITEFLLGDMKSKLLFCWDESHCATTPTTTLENVHKNVVFKELNRLWEKHDPKLPWKKGDYNKTNTVLLDDSPYKALLNPLYTAIFPHPYDHRNKTDTSLASFGDLRLHLERLAEAKNVQKFIKKNPFGQQSITEESESWEFYRNAIAQVRN